jgi:hypothetical protein
VGAFFQSPTFSPPVPPIALGTNGQTLQMVGGLPKFAAGGAGANAPVPGSATIALATGNYNNYAGGGFGVGTQKLFITPTGGDVTITGLAALSDGLMALIANMDANNNIFLPFVSGLSLAANQFYGPGGSGSSLFLSPGARALLVYFSSGGISGWSAQ